MKSHFSWETDRHQDWIEDEETTPEPPGWTAGLTRRRLLLVIVLQIGLVFALMVWLVVRRQQSLEWRIGEDVVASHRILQQAVAAQDLELFTSFLSKENSAWLKAQRELLAAGSLMGRDALGLALQPTSSNPSVELSPDWRQAELTFAQQYLATDLEGTIRPVRLQHTAVYRYYRTQRWLQVPPDEAFWGETVTNSDDTGLLTVEYPERDSSWSQRLGEDLRKALQAICTGQPSGACNGLHVTLQLTTDPAVLVSLAERPTPIFHRRAFVMPAPTLVGIPLDEESYQALYDGYKERILETVRNNSQAPIPIPEQVVQLLCRDGRGRGLQPYQYDPWFDTWSPVPSVPTEVAYNYLRPMPEDSGIVLRRGLPGTQLYDLELSLLRDGQTYPLVELSGNEEELVTLVGFAPGPQSRLLVRLNDRSVSNVDYQALNVDACAAGHCVFELAGLIVA